MPTLRCADFDADRQINRYARIARSRFDANHRKLPDVHEKPYAHMSLPTVADFYTEQDVARYREAGYWRDETPASILDDLATNRGEDLFVLNRDGGLTYGSFRARAWSFAASLVALGVGPGDRVLVQVPNCSELLIAMMGVTRAGAVIVPAMMTYHAGEISHLIENTQAKVSVTAAHFRGFDHVSMHQELRDGSPWLQHVVTIRGDAHGSLPFEELSDAGSLPAEDLTLPPMPSADDGHVIIHTSGTESKPKASHSPGTSQPSTTTATCASPAGSRTSSSAGV